MGSVTATTTMRHAQNWRGLRLREALDAAGMNAEDMGKRMHVTGAAVRNWCLGRREIGVDELEQFASITGYPVEYFIRPEYRLPADFDVHKRMERIAEQISELSGELADRAVRPEQVDISFRKQHDLSEDDWKQIMDIIRRAEEEERERE